VPREVRLIGKPEGAGRGQDCLPAPQSMLGFLNPALKMPGVRRQSCGDSQRTAELRGLRVDDLRQLPCTDLTIEYGCQMGQSVTYEVRSRATVWFEPRLLEEYSGQSPKRLRHARGVAVECVPNGGKGRQEVRLGADGRWLKKGQAAVLEPLRRNVKRAQAPGLRSVRVSDHVRLTRVKDCQTTHRNARNPREVLESPTAGQCQGELVLGMRMSRSAVGGPHSFESFHTRRFMAAKLLAGSPGHTWLK
jgi:hypothetical protein